MESKDEISKDVFTLCANKIKSLEIKNAKLVEEVKSLKIHLQDAAREMKLLIDEVNTTRRKSRGNTDEPEFYDYQTCYELMKLSIEINNND